MAGEKKKIWDIEVPLLRKDFAALAISKEQLEGKFLKLDLSRIIKGKNMDASLKISLKDDKLLADFYSLLIIQSSIKRMIRKGTSWIEDSFITNSKDNLKMQIKPFMITKKKVSRSLKNALRKASRELLLDYVSKKNSQEMFSSIISGKLQREMSSKLKKIYPLSNFEIRVCKIKS